MFDRPNLQAAGNKTRRWQAQGRMAPAVLMLGLWLGLIGLSQSEQLHRFLHADAHQPHHECLLTLFTKSQVTGAPSVVFVVLPAVVVPGPVLGPGLAHLPAVHWRLAPGRAPPRGFLLR